MSEPTQVPNPIEVVNPVEIINVNGALKKNVRNDRIKAIGIFLLGASALVTAIITGLALRSEIALNKEQECRAEVSFTVQNLSDEVQISLAQIFVAAIQHPGQPGQPSPEVMEVGQRLQEQISELIPALEERAEAIETCRE